MKRRIIPYNSNLKELARKLRNNSTFGEILLWKHLSGKKMKGFDFHRQKPILNYIADFYCAEPNLIIEIDGYSHENEEQQLKDLRREKELSEYNLHIIRFSEREVRYNINNVLRTIEFYIEERQAND